MSIADLLNPNGPHYKRDAYLNIFFDIISSENESYRKIKTKNAKVTTCVLECFPSRISNSRLSVLKKLSAQALSPMLLAPGMQIKPSHKPFNTFLARSFATSCCFRLEVRASSTAFSLNSLVNTRLSPMTTSPLVYHRLIFPSIIPGEVQV
jgi:hypothetical protein